MATVNNTFVAPVPQFCENVAPIDSFVECHVATDEYDEQQQQQQGGYGAPQYGQYPAQQYYAAPPQQQQYYAQPPPQQYAYAPAPVPQQPQGPQVGRSRLTFYTRV